MDKVKAIKILKPLVESYVDYANITMKEEDDDIADALEMAIEALKALDVPDTNVGDMISRRAAIELCDWYDNPSLHDDLEKLPPAQPEQRWIPWDSGKFPEESGTYTVTAHDGATKRVTYAKYQKRLKRWELTGARAYWRVLAWMPLPAPYKGGDSD